MCDQPAHRDALWDLFELAFSALPEFWF